MKTITVYGPGCMKCKQAEEAAKRAVSEGGADAEVVKVSDIQQMVEKGIMSTPAIAVDGVIKATGRVPKTEEILAWLK